MPEGPEVEFAARLLRERAVGRTVEAVAVTRGAGRLLRPLGPAAFSRALAGARVEGVARRGKHLLVTAAIGAARLGLLSHLGMTGKWIGRAAGGAPPAHLRASLRLDDGTALDYVDPRGFGRLRIVAGARFDEVAALAALGPDALAAPIDVARLAARLARTRRSIKVALLDQRLLAGLGNIHAGEALWRARLDPRRRADRLGSPEVAALARGVTAAVRFALGRLRGPGIRYVEEGGENPFRVYGRAGAPCPRCGEAIRRIVQGGRSTFLCRRCQG